MAILKLSAPWVTYYRELNELFRRDAEVRVIYDEENNTIKMYVDNPAKAEALAMLLPMEKRFGNVVLTIQIIPANKLVGSALVNFTEAFKGNPIVHDIVTVKCPGLGDLIYVLFENKVVQYFNDNLGDLNGFCSTLYQDIANRVIENRDGLYFCTMPMIGDTCVNAPLGEWP